MKLLAAACFLVSLAVLSACGGDNPDPTQTPSAATAEDDAAFPRDADWRDCELPMGGPPPLSGETAAVSGRCATQRIETEDGLLVTDVIEWRCEDWNANVPGYPACAGEFGRFTSVSREGGGESEPLSAVGHFPPWLAQ